jgi:hypothetical protein
LGTTALNEEAALNLFKQMCKYIRTGSNFSPILLGAIVYHTFASDHKFLLNRDVCPENVLIVKHEDNVKLKCMRVLAFYTF